MIASLTGFGRAEHTDDRGRICVELKSVNNRFLQLDVHVPYGYAWIDARIRSLVSETVSRGKVFLNLEVIDYAPNQNIVLNRPLIGKLFELQSELEKQYNRTIPASLDGFLALPGMVKSENAADLEQVWERVMPVVRQALEAFVEFRRREGEKLAQDLRQRRDRLVQLVDDIEQRLPTFRREFAERFRARIAELADKPDIDETRLTTEIAIWAERSDITEELTRLKCHLSALGDLFTKREPIGRKLDFLLQELHREANTVNNKAGDLSVIQYILEVKSELEKIREQAQNIE